MPSGQYWANTITPSSKTMPFRDILRWTPWNSLAFEIRGVLWQCGLKCLWYSKQVVQTILHLQEKNKFFAPGMRKFTFSLKKWPCGFGDGIPFCWRAAPCLPVHPWFCSYITTLESSVYIFDMFPCAEHETKLQSKSHYGFALAPFSIPFSHCLL